MPRPKQRTAELRERLLQVAVSMLQTEGVAGFTTRNVARKAATSTPAVYELFGDKAGLLREVFFEGFRLLGHRLGQLPDTGEPRADLIAIATTFRRFAQQNPLLVEVMYSRPFADFDPTPSEEEAGRAVRDLIVGRVQRCIDAGALAGDATDIAHVLLALTLGLASAEKASRLGRSTASVDRRWALGLDAVLDGLAPPRKRPAGPDRRTPAGKRRPAR